MFAKRLLWGLDYSPRNILSLCCGFFAKSEAGGKFSDGGGPNGDSRGSNPGGGGEGGEAQNKASGGASVRCKESADSKESATDCALLESSNETSAGSGSHAGTCSPKAKQAKKSRATKGDQPQLQRITGLQGHVQVETDILSGNGAVRTYGATSVTAVTPHEEPTAANSNADVRDKSICGDSRAADAAEDSTDVTAVAASSGAAYQYEDDTSSDSDDEVLKQFHEMKRSASVRSSLRSAQSARSKRSVRTDFAARDDSHSDAASLMEKGQPQSPQHGDSNRGFEPAQPGEPQHPAASLLDRDTPTHGPDAPLVPWSLAGSQVTVSEVAVSGATSAIVRVTGDQRTYENRAFHPELSAMSGSLTGSEQGLSSDLTSANDEHLFDVSDLQQEPTLISKCGSLEVTFTYDPAKGRMTITVHRAREIPARDRGGANSTQVRMMLLPTKKQRFKTKVKEGQDPVYEETFAFSKISPEEVAGMGLRFRLYGLERMRRERMVGESVIGFASLNLDLTSTHWVILEPRSNLSHGDSGMEVCSLSRSDSASSTQSLQHGGMPELLLGLAYSATTGRLAVQVLKGSNFRNMASNRAPDTYVKVALMSATGEELQRCKTSVRRGQPNPLFKETFMLQVALFQLPEVTLMVAVYSKRSMKKKEMIGWFSLGQNSSGEEESSHWSDMRESKGEEVCRWHVLLES